MCKILAILVAVSLFAQCYSYILPLGVNFSRHLSRLYGTSAIKAKKIARMQASMKHVRVAAPITLNVERDPLTPMVEFIAKVADERKASSIKAFRVAHLTEVTQFILIIQGSNNRQISAIASSVEDEVLKDFKETPFARDGTAASGWFVLDYGSVIAHVMTPAMTSFYKLEKKWLAAEPVDLSHVISPSATQSEDSYSEQSSTGIAGSTDDWGFHSEEDGAAMSSNESDDGRSDSSVPTRSTSTTTTSGKHTELPAEDVAFWGEELAEQMYLNKISPPLVATRIIPVPSATASAPSVTSVTSGLAEAPREHSTASTSAPSTSMNESRSGANHSNDTSAPVKAKMSKSAEVDVDIADTKKEGETGKRTAGVVKVTKSLLGRGLRRKTR